METTTINSNWKQDVRNYFKSEDNQNYLAFMGLSKFPFSLVKLEIMNYKYQYPENEQQSGSFWD